ncbi:hypothetical protein, partial [Phocaeicola barnesiae]|uniref:hypothetical protein n=1 Tax=Phocaeicola barnesiae TaxID=376804 RepID=UPI00241D5776
LACEGVKPVSGNTSVRDAVLVYPSFHCFREDFGMLILFELLHPVSSVHCFAEFLSFHVR